jgi:uncharacterized membrane protein
MSRRLERLALLASLLLGAMLRLGRLGGRSLWLDEAATWFYAQQPLPAIWANYLDPHPPLYYAAMHFWLRLGESELILRLPSALLSLLALALLARLGGRLIGRRGALLAVALLALSPLDLWYAQEARMYAPLAFICLLMALGLAQGGWRGALLFALALLLGLYLSYLALPLWGGLSGIWLASWWRGDRPRSALLAWLGPSLLAALIGSPWWPRLAALLAESRPPYLFAAIGRAVGLVIPMAAFLLAPLLALAGGAIGAARLARLLAQPAWRGRLPLVAATAFALITLAAAFPRLYTLKRILEAGWPLAILGLAWLVTISRQWRLAPSLLVLSLLVSLVTLLWQPKDDWRSAAAAIEDRIAPGELVWLDPPRNFIPFSYYAPSRPYESGLRGELGARLTALANAGAEGVWLIGERPPAQPPPTSASEAWLDLHWRLVETVPLYGLEARHYSPE